MWSYACKLEEEMATHSSILAWEIPWTEEAGGLESMGSQRVSQTELNGSNMERVVDSSKSS